jgi:formate--tetrahydrofolate ligase
MHGNVPLEELKEPSPEGVRRGLANLDRHVRNIQDFGQTVIVCFNKFASDTEEEIAIVREHCEKELHTGFALNNAFAEGGEGAVDLANLVVETIEKNPSKPLRFAYYDQDSVETKIGKIAKNIYKAEEVVLTGAAKKKVKLIKELGATHFPICIAKTQFSFSQNAKLYGAPEGFTFEIKDLVINMGAEMIVAIAGDIIRMPGLPKSPQALRIDLVDGQIEGLS